MEYQEYIKKLADLEAESRIYRQQAEKDGGVKSSAVISEFWDRLQQILDELKAEEPEKFGDFRISAPEPDSYPRMFMPARGERYSHADFENLHDVIKELRLAMGWQEAT